MHNPFIPGYAARFGEYSQPKLRKQYYEEFQCTVLDGKPPAWETLRNLISANDPSLTDLPDRGGVNVPLDYASWDAFDELGGDWDAWCYMWSQQARATGSATG